MGAFSCCMGDRSVQDPLPKGEAMTFQSASERHKELLAAIEALPETASGDWQIPEAQLKAAGLEGDVARAKEIVVQFAVWARAASSTFPLVEDAEMQATDFNDYYKLVMSRVQYMYAQATPGGLGYPQCCFQSQLRRRSGFKKDGVERTLGVFDVGRSASRVSCWEVARPVFRAALTAVGARRFDAATLRLLMAQRFPGAAVIENSLAPMADAWTAALDGSPLFTLLPEGADFSGSTEACEVRVVEQHGQAVVLAQGPWFRVTFVETPVLQCMCQFMTGWMCAEGDEDGVAWCNEALVNFALAAHQVQTHVLAPKHAIVAFFSSRRAPHPEFHLLQHLYLAEVWGVARTTSSLLAGRVLGGRGVPQNLIGTSAHEGPMAMIAMHPELDGRFPISSVLWTLLFWACTGNKAVLTDAFGSATFKYLLAECGLLGEVAMARQDSGQLERFSAIFAEQRRMASDIEAFPMLLEGVQLGYVAFGIGGALGERRRTHTEFSLAAKVTKACYLDPASQAVLTGYAGKLGDFGLGSGSWADYDPQQHEAQARPKVIMSDETDGEAMFERFVRYAAAGDRKHDAEVRGESTPPLLCQQDAHALVRCVRTLAQAAGFEPYPAMRRNLLAYADTVEAAAAQLPTESAEQEVTRDRGGAAPSRALSNSAAVSCTCA